MARYWGPVARRVIRGHSIRGFTVHQKRGKEWWHGIRWPGIGGFTVIPKNSKHSVLESRNRQTTVQLRSVLSVRVYKSLMVGNCIMSR